MFLFIIRIFALSSLYFYNAVCVHGVNELKIKPVFQWPFSAYILHQVPFIFYFHPELQNTPIPSLLHIRLAVFFSFV
jgi:hypothetical protein